MPLELRDVDRDTNFSALARCLFEGYEDPPQPFFHAWFPIFGPSLQDREASLTEAANRLRDWNNDQPITHQTSVWKKVVDTETGVIAGASLWKIYSEDPFREEQRIQAKWFPEGGARLWVEKMIEEHDRPRKARGRKLSKIVE